MTAPAGADLPAAQVRPRRSSRLTPSGPNQDQHAFPGAAGEEWTHASNHRRPTAPHRGAPAGGRTDAGGKDQDRLCQPALRGLGSLAVRVAARGAILVRPAYLPAPYPGQVRAGRPATVSRPVRCGSRRLALRGGAAATIDAFWNLRARARPR